MRRVVDEFPEVGASFEDKQERVLFESLWALIVIIHSALWRIDGINLKAPQLDKLLPLYMPAIAYYQELFFFQLPH